MSAKIILDRLFQSLQLLEGAIEDTKKTIMTFQSGKIDLLERIHCYEQVLKKQRILATTLAKNIEDKNWYQVSQTIELIKGSSILIQLDSKSIIAELDNDSNGTETLVN